MKKTAQVSHLLFARTSNLRLTCGPLPEGLVYISTSQANQNSIVMID